MLLTFPSVVLDVLAEAPAVSIVRGFGFFRIWLGYNAGSEVVFSNSSLPPQRPRESVSERPLAAPSE